MTDKTYKLTSGDPHLSVRELIHILKKCPDQDAWVVLPKPGVGKMVLCTGVATHSTHCSVVLLGEICWSDSGCYPRTTDLEG